MTTPRKDGPRSKASPIPIEQQAKLRAAITDMGWQEIAQLSGLSGPTVCGAAAGKGVHASTKKLVNLFLAELQAAS